MMRVVVMLRRPAAAGLLLLPGALTAFLSFSGGGYFAGTTGLVGAVLALVLVVRSALAKRPLGGLSGPSVVCAVALACYAVWILASAFWSEAPARALIEYQRALVYLLAFVLFASMPYSPERLGWMIKGVALAILGVCGIALTTRVAPDLWPIASNVSNDRLSYPITYWNGLGLLSATGVLLCLHLSADSHESVPARVAAAAAVPVLAATLMFTFSRGAIAAGLIGLVVYLALGRPRGVVGALLACVPATLIAVSAAYGADLVQTSDYATGAAVKQGHNVALAVLVSAVGAALVRLLALPLDARLGRLGPPSPNMRRALAATLIVAVVALGATAVVADAPGYVARQYDRFVEGRNLQEGDSIRTRLTDPANNGRLDHWRVAVDSFRESPLRGSGAGTYQLLWARDRPYAFTVIDGHSLYLETLGELGLVGLALIVIVLSVALAALWRGARDRSRGRARQAAVFAALLAWALHSGIDWNWELPAVTLWAFALAGFALAVPRAGKGRMAFALPRSARVAIALGWLALAVTPALVAGSQRQLDRSVAAFKRDDCATAIDASLDSIAALSLRPEPWELLGYCNIRVGEGPLALRALSQAVELDPRSWEPRYGLALARAAAGRDPRRAAQQALDLNPREPLARQAVEEFNTGDRRRWRKRGLEAPLPLP